MAYQTPTSVTQMHQILRQIYFDYRLRIDAYEDAGLKDIVLERIQFNAKTDEELLSMARELVTPWYDQEYDKDKKSVETKIQALMEKKENLSYDTEKKKTALTEEVAKSKEEIKKEAIKKGYVNSDVMLSKIAKLEEYRLNKMEQIDVDANQTISSIEEEISSLQITLDALRENLNEYFENKVNAKFIELKEEQDKEEREVFKYNNSIDEKEKRSKNANISANASLKLRYLEIRSQSYSKEELVDMGYYEDVIACVRGYYDSFSNAYDAYNEFVAENKIMLYLEDYYGNLLSLYKARAGL